MRKQAEHRIRAAASLARPGWTWAAAILMNLPVVAGAVLVGWFAYAAYEPALVAIATILFVLAALWAVLVTHDSWRVLRRFTRLHGTAPR
jgi:membrane protein YdbS with pleckstrin-like domain